MEDHLRITFLEIMIQEQTRKNLQTMLMAMIDTPDKTKKIRINSHSSLGVKYSTVTYASNIFGVKNKYIRRNYLNQNTTHTILKI